MTQDLKGEAGNYSDFSPGGWLKKVPVAVANQRTDGFIIS